MYGRLGYLHLVHLAEANAQRRRLAEGSGPSGITNSSKALATDRRHPRTMVELDIPAFFRLLVVLGLALAAAATIGMAIG